MKISYNWLQEYFEKELPNPKDLADILNVRAFEVEEVEEKDGDSVFEIKVTPDRAPDCLSHIGIAREVSRHTGIDMIGIPLFESITEDFKTAFSTDIVENICNRYMIQEVRDVVVADSPLALKLKLEAIGQRSINTIVDITNLVMYEIGQPMHAFDGDKLTGSVLKVAVPTALKFTTLDNKEVELTSDDLTIQDEQDNLAIAGVKGGKKAEVDYQTKNIILEAANFFPVRVRKTSKRTGIQTDSSKRFENGLTSELTERALNLASFYISKYASNSNTKFSNVVDFYPRPQTRAYQVGLSSKTIEQKLQLQLSEEKITSLVPHIGYQKIQSLEEIRLHIDGVLNTPYKFGASVLFDAPRTFDCSGLVAYLYSLIGIQIPRTSIDQLIFSRQITQEELSFGDLVFSNSGDGDVHFETKEFLPGTKFEKGVDHVGMYIGDGKILHASRYQESGTVIEELSSSKQFSNIVYGGRIIGEQDFPRYVFNIPYERLDLRKEIDLIEEIGRTYGYEHIVPVEPKLALQSKELSTYDKLATLKSHLISQAFDEVITYSFGKKGDISIIKPLAKDKSYLRTSLVTGLQESLELNFKNKELFAQDIIKIFEIGHVFTKEGEKVVLGLGVKSAHKKTKAKQILEQTIQFLSEKLNTQINIEIKDNQEVVEINIDTLLPHVTHIENKLYPPKTKPYTPFSQYPYITRDIAVWASNSKTKQDIENIITTHGTNLLVRFDLFDEFAKDGKTSYGYRLVFQSFEKTLTDEEIAPIVDSIYGTLKADSDFEIR